MRRTDHFEATRLDILALTGEEQAEIQSILGRFRVGRRLRWQTWTSGNLVHSDRMIRYTVFDEDAAEAMWMRFGDDPRLVDGLRNISGSASKKFVEAYTHWIDAPFSTISPIIRWARETLHRHHFEWGGQADRWMLWFKTEEALQAFETEWPGHGTKPAPMHGETDDERLLYVHRIRTEARQAA